MGSVPAGAICDRWFSVSAGMQGPFGDSPLFGWTVPPGALLQGRERSAVIPTTSQAWEDANIEDVNRDGLPLDSMTSSFVTLVLHLSGHSRVKIVGF